ncbi:MAG: peptide deformylase [Clostridia bacterium]|nr:peptide deformylase [Clostridia bacterium]
MAIRTIRGEGDEILSKKSREVDISNIKDEKIQELIDDMLETMYKANGVGLAAVQVGILKQIVVIDVEEDCSNPIVLINPKIIKEKGAQEVEEGCLSFPNKFAKVVRPAEVIVEALDRDGKKIKMKAKELLAQAISHELDHLNGIVFVDKIIPGTLEVVKPSDNTKNKNSKNNKNKE